MAYYPEWEVEQIRKRFRAPEAGEETLEDKIRAAEQEREAPKSSRSRETER